MTGPKEPAVETVTVAAFPLPHRPDAPLAMMTGATARSLGLHQPAARRAGDHHPRCRPSRSRTGPRRAFADNYFVNVERGPFEGDTLFLTVLAIVAGVITLGAAAIATGLAAADSRADLGTLAAVGASPGVRRALSLSQSGVIAGLGSLLGVVGRARRVRRRAVRAQPGLTRGLAGPGALPDRACRG